MRKTNADTKKAEKQKAGKPADQADTVKAGDQETVMAAAQADAEADAVPGKVDNDGKAAVKKATKKSGKQSAKQASQAPEAPAAVKPKKESAKAKADSRAETKEKPRKAKLVRDSFTMPEAEYKALQDVKREFLKAGVEVKKSELLRIGVALIKQTDRAKLQEVLASLPSLKAGRPKIDRTPE
jgi:hypothetical protein